MDTAQNKSSLSDLLDKIKGYRDDFLRRSTVSGICRADLISDEFKLKNLPDDFENTLFISYGKKQHKLEYCIGTKLKPKLIKNTDTKGTFEDYKAVLYAIWPKDEDDKVAWLIKKPDHIEFEKKIDDICKSVKPLLEIKKYRKPAREIIEKIRYGRSIDWATIRETDVIVRWSYLKQLDEIIKKLEDETGQKIGQNNNWHNEDFTEVVWNGKRYKFNTPQQTLAVEHLWTNKRAREKNIGEAIGSAADNFRLIHIFRQKGQKTKMHPAWGKMIIPDGKGIYALAEKKTPPKK